MPGVLSGRAGGGKGLHGRGICGADTVLETNSISPKECLEFFPAAQAEGKDSMEGAFVGRIRYWNRRAYVRNCRVL